MDDAFELGQGYCLQYPKSVTLAPGYFERNGLVPIAQSFLGGAGCHQGILHACATLWIKPELPPRENKKCRDVLSLTQHGFNLGYHVPAGCFYLDRAVWWECGRGIYCSAAHPKHVWSSGWWSKAQTKQHLLWRGTGCKHLETSFLCRASCLIPCYRSFWGEMPEVAWERCM